MEILQFGLCEKIGGIETYLRKINDNIDRDCFHFSFIDMTGENGHPAFKEHFLETGCDFYKVCPRNVSILQNRKDLERLFSEHHFDVLHFSANTLSYMAPVYVALRHGCAVIVHSRSANYAAHGITKVLDYYNKMRLKHMHVARIGVSKEACDWMFSPINQSVVYPNGVDTVKFRFSAESRSAIREALGCDDKLVIGNVGRFTLGKNQEYAIEIFEKIKQIKKNAVLWFVGAGSEMNRIKELAKSKGLSDDVFFLGQRDDLPMLFSGMDMHLFTSEFEGLGNVLIEAQTSGLPCLSSNRVPSITQITNHAEFMPLEESPDIWAKRLVKMIENSRIDRENAYKVIEEKGWSVQKEIERLENLYTKVAQGDLS